jgi:hypothetical protein
MTNLTHKSSAAPTITYDPMTRVLTVEYARPGGKSAVWNYQGVPTHVNAALERAESKGSFLVKHVKGKYKAVEVGTTGGPML